MLEQDIKMRDWRIDAYKQLWECSPSQQSKRKMCRTSAQRDFKKGTPRAKNIETQTHFVLLFVFTGCRIFSGQEVYIVYLYQFKTYCNVHCCRYLNAWHGGLRDSRVTIQCPTPPVLDVCVRLLWLHVFLMTQAAELLLCLHCWSQLQEEAVRYCLRQQKKHCIRSWNRWPAKNM